jgi:eukaryotic-like serine/threonine-protein kinase
MPLATGSRLGPYEILDPLGAGGMGEVYRARDAKLGRDVALKVLPEAFARDAERLARSQREAKVLASLNHPNIASIYGLEDSGATHALVMELVEGPTLADRIHSGPIPIDETLRIAKQICEALEYAHERGIVHRDLKPANVKVTNDDAVKVLDFGLAKALEGDASSIDIANSPTISRLATQAGVLLGTAAFMSPEQAKGKPVDRRADIWAFGCVLYEMLTGKMAFTGETVTDTLAAVIRAEPDWSQLPAGMPVRVRVLLQRCLQKDPKQRLQAIGDARISIDEVLAGAPDPTSGAAAAPVLAPLWRRALPWALFAATLVSFAALAFVHFREKPIVAEAVRLEMPWPEKAIMAATGTFGLSPDGRQFAFFAAGPEGVQRLWIRSLDSLEARPLPGSESSVVAPFFWSPDSRYIAFDAGGKLKTIDISGGSAQTLCDVAQYAVGGSWNRDGVIIFGQSPGVIMRISANGGPASPLTSLDSSRGEIQHVLPSFLPDGRHFIYLRTSDKPENSGVYVGSLDARPGQQDSKRLLATAYGPAYVPSSDPGFGQVLFVRDGTLMAQSFDARQLEPVGDPIPMAEHLGSYRDFGFFSASANGVLVYRTGGGGDSQFTWFDRQGKVLGTAGEQGLYRTPALSPDGRRAAVSLRDSQNGKLVLWLFDFSRGTSTRFTFGSSSATSPIWSPDGNRIIFMSKPSGVYDLYQKPANGATDEELLLKSSENKVPTSFSHDGRFLLYLSVDPKTKDDLWVLPLGGDKKPFPFLQTEFNEVDGQFSPDGRWVAYVSDESGRNEIYVRTFSPDSTAAASDTAGKWQVSYGGGTDPRWSADGKELYYMTPDWKLMAVEVTTNPVFQAGAAKLLFQAPQQTSVTVGDYTVDGKRFLFLAPAGQTAPAPFTVVLNWQAGLKK